MLSLLAKRVATLRESNDGHPLATSVSDLYLAFPYDRLPSDNSLIAFVMRPEVMLLLIGVYILSEKPLNRLRRTQWGTTFCKGPVFRMLVAFHNLQLAIFSFACVFNVLPLVYKHYRQYGFMAIYCDRDGLLWRSGFGAWSILFYLSKYWEFVDTWILVLKGKGANFLQVYHHSGIVFVMHGAVASQSSWLLIVVLLNAAIHTLMYTYFCIKTIAPKLEIKAAKYLTMAQIGQFLLGMASTYGVLFMGNSCGSISSRFSLTCLHVYGIGLIALFVSFAKRKYKQQ
ncbi:hypothetical protein MPSEU_001067000 [Mayamaea pseudoterrestris]|nr:hypothetical protein MPSEU_001067000 [Mayamaea pseudoterrestris]